MPCVLIRSLCQTLNTKVRCHCSKKYKTYEKSCFILLKSWMSTPLRPKCIFYRNAMNSFCIKTRLFHWPNAVSRHSVINQNYQYIIKFFKLCYNLNNKIFNMKHECVRPIDLVLSPKS